LHIPKGQKLLNQILNIAFKTTMAELKPGAGLQIPEGFFGGIPNDGMEKTPDVVADVIQVIQMLTGEMNGGLKTNFEGRREGA
jgi:hypothetical protein